MLLGGKSSQSELMAATEVELAKKVVYLIINGQKCVDEEVTGRTDVYEWIGRYAGTLVGFLDGKNFICSIESVVPGLPFNVKDIMFRESEGDIRTTDQMKPDRVREFTDKLYDMLHNNGCEDEAQKLKNVRKLWERSQAELSPELMQAFGISPNNLPGKQPIKPSSNNLKMYLPQNNSDETSNNTPQMSLAAQEAYKAKLRREEDKEKRKREKAEKAAKSSERQAGNSSKEVSQSSLPSEVILSPTPTEKSEITDSGTIDYPKIESPKLEPIYPKEGAFEYPKDIAEYSIIYPLPKNEAEEKSIKNCYRSPNVYITEEEVAGEMPVFVFGLNAKHYIVCSRPQTPLDLTCIKVERVAGSRKSIPMSLSASIDILKRFQSKISTIPELAIQAKRFGFLLHLFQEDEKRDKNRERAKGADKLKQQALAAKERREKDAQKREAKRQAEELAAREIAAQKEHEELEKAAKAEAEKIAAENLAKKQAESVIAKQAKEQMEQFLGNKQDIAFICDRNESDNLCLYGKMGGTLFYINMNTKKPMCYAIDQDNIRPLTDTNEFAQIYGKIIEDLTDERFESILNNMGETYRNFHKKRGGYKKMTSEEISVLHAEACEKLMMPRVVQLHSKRTIPQRGRKDLIKD